MSKPDALPLRREPRPKPPIALDAYINRRMEQLKRMGFEPGMSFTPHVNDDGRVAKVIWTLTDLPPFDHS